MLLISDRKAFFFMNSLLKYLIKISVIAAITFILLKFVFCVSRMDGNYMYPSVRDGDLCISYLLEPIHTGDVVLYDLNGKMKIGRVVGANMETVSIGGQQVVINGAPYSEVTTYPTEPDESSGISYPIMLDGTNYFLLNDYRYEFNDSRTFGPINKSNIHGKLIFVLRRRGF